MTRRGSHEGARCEYCGALASNRVNVERDHRRVVVRSIATCPEHHSRAIADAAAFAHDSNAIDFLRNTRHG